MGGSSDIFANTARFRMGSFSDCLINPLQTAELAGSDRLSISR